VQVAESPGFRGTAALCHRPPENWISRKRTVFGLIALALFGCLLAGCGNPPPSGNAPKKSKQASASHAQTKQASRPSRSTATTSKTPAAFPTANPNAPQTPNSPDEPPEQRPGIFKPPRGPLLASLLEGPVDSAARWIPNLPRMVVDEQRTAAAGIRKVVGKRITLYTDLPKSDEIDRLPAIFDLAFPQWCEYFSLDPAKHADWKMTGFLISSKDVRPKFTAAGLVPKELPDFQHGFSRNHELWLYDQPSDYYRRHLFLHEGTHGLMNTLLGACGPPWYMEGVAELLSTHRWADGQLTLNVVPADRDEVPYWGRVKLIKDAIGRGQPLQLWQVVQYPPHAHINAEPYAWCWALAVLMDRDPRYRDRFRQLQKFVVEPDFNERFYRLMGEDLNELGEQWQVFSEAIEYGIDPARTAIEFTPGADLPADGANVSVLAERGWQSSKLRLTAGKEYRLQASGRYQVADRPKIWWCEPGGVSIRYYQGRPLGILLAAVRPDDWEDGDPSGLVKPIVVGLETTLTPEHHGTLYLRINDSAAEMHDNAGSLTVEVTSP